MPLVKKLAPDDAPITVRNYFAAGDPGPLVSTIAQVPELLQVTLPFIGKALGPSSIDIRTKEIVILRASAVQACKYCVNTHSFVARNSGLSHAEVLALRNVNTNSKNDADFNQRESTLIEWTDVISSTAAPISADLKKRFSDLFSEAEIVELTLLVGATVMLNRYATALELPTDETHLSFLQEEGLLY